MSTKLYNKFKVKAKDRRKPKPVCSNMLLDSQRLKVSGIVPSTFSSSLRYQFKHNIQGPNPKTLDTDEVYRLIDNVCTPATSLPILKWTIGTDVKEYTLSNTCEYFEVKKSIDRIRLMKDKLEDVEFKNEDVFQNIIHREPCLLNRCSLKLLNMNTLFDNIIGRSVRPGTAYADLCAAPGGFTYFLLHTFPEYAMFAFLCSMPAVNDYLTYRNELYNLSHNSVLTFLDGDLLNCDFRIAFQKRVHTKVDFVLADGGINYYQKENYQEYYTKNLYMAQIITGLRILKEGGFMLCKFFETYTKFTVDMLYLLSFVFHKITISKPITSKSGNSERYIAFEGLMCKPDRLVKYFDSVLQMSEELKPRGHMIVSLMEMLPPDDRFLHFKDDIIRIGKHCSSDQFTALQHYLGMITDVEIEVINPHKIVHQWLDIIRGRAPLVILESTKN